MLQYKQHSLLVHGLWRRVYTEFFSSESHSALDHAHKFGQKIVALGGVPTVEVGATVRQSLNVEEMLRQDLELKRQAMQAYVAAHTLAHEGIALRNMLEDQIEQEQRDIEEIGLYLDMVKTGSGHTRSQLTCRVTYARMVTKAISRNRLPHVKTANFLIA